MTLEQEMAHYMRELDRLTTTMHDHGDGDRLHAMGRNETYALVAYFAADPSTPLTTEFLDRIMRDDHDDAVLKTISAFHSIGYARALDDLRNGRVVI